METPIVIQGRGAISFVEYCAYLSPVIGPSTNASYHQFEGMQQVMNTLPDVNTNRLIRASFEFLAGPEEKPVELDELSTFLQQPWREVLARLECYSPIEPLIRYTQSLAADDEGPFKNGRRAKAFIEDAAYYIQGVIGKRAAQAEQQARDERYAAELAAIEQQSADMIARLNERMWTGIILLVLMFALGSILSAYIMYEYLSK